MRLLVLLLVLLWTVPVHAAGMEDEAKRQLTFSREELAAGQYERALKSAASALRLHPSLYDAMVAKALAYEGLGELERAEVMLRAYLEFVGEERASEESKDALGRIQEAQEATARGRRARRRTPVAKRPASPGGEPTETAGVEPDALDPADYRQRVESALAAGRCAAAFAAADELAASLPTDPLGWRLRGDAARCASRTRQAVDSYLKAEAAGDGTVSDLVAELRRSLGSLRVEVTLEGSAIVPQVRVLAGREAIEPVSSEGRSFLFQDLPTDVSLLVAVAGVGIESRWEEVGVAEAGAVREVTVSPELAGTGTLSLSDFDPKVVSATLLLPWAERALTPEGHVTVTRGEAVVRVAGEQGEVDVTLQVRADATLEFDPRPHVPSKLTLIGLPVGSVVRVFVESKTDVPLELERTAPGDDAVLDEATGVYVAAPLEVGPVLGGSGGVFVSHPALGEGSQELVLEPGAVNAATYDWSEMSGLPSLTASYEVWRARRAELALRGARTRAMSGALIGGGAALLAIGLAGAASSDAELKGVVAELEGLAAGGLAPSDEGSYRSHAESATETRGRVGGLLGMGVAGAAVASGGLTFLIATERRRGHEVSALGEWDPLAVGSTAE